MIERLERSRDGRAREQGRAASRTLQSRTVGASRREWAFAVVAVQFAVFSDGPVLFVVVSVRALAPLLGFEAREEVFSAHRRTAAGLHGVSAGSVAVRVRITYRY